MYFVLFIRNFFRLIKKSFVIKKKKKNNNNNESGISLQNKNIIMISGKQIFWRYINYNHVHLFIF